MDLGIMSNLDIAHLRLHNQYISQPAFQKPGEVVGWLGAVQAQDYAAAKWSLGLRMQAPVEQDIERTFADGSILRTHLLRPTWHFVTPADIRWLLKLTAPRVHAVNGSMYRKLGIDGDAISRSKVVLVVELQNGRHRTRDELRDALNQAGLAVENGLRLAYIMMHAELDGLVCSGPRREKQFTYALLEERVPEARKLEREEALVELAERFFISRGPATVQDFAKLSGLAMAEARRGLEAVSATLYQEQVGGRVYWFPEPIPFVKKSSPSAHMLSIYDEYISGYKDHRDIGEPEIGARLVAMGNALSYIILVNGQIVGAWKRSLRKDAVVIETSLFTPLIPAEQAAVTQAAQRYGQFLQLPVVFA